MTTVTTNFNQDAKAISHIFTNPETGIRVLFLEDDIDFVRRVIDQVWNQLADDMFMTDMGVRDESLTFSRMDVFTFGMERYDSCLEGEETIRMQELHMSIRDLGWGSEAWLEFVKKVTWYEVYGY